MATRIVAPTVARLAAPVIRGNPYANPMDVYNALIRARMEGSLYDPYNLSKAIGSVGANYGRLGDLVSNAARANAASNIEQSREDAGFYPAAATAATTAQNLGNAANQQKLQAIQDIEAAWQAAKAAGLDPNSDEFNQYMLSHVNTRGGAAAITPDVNAGYQRQGLMNLQKQYAKAYIDNEIRKQAAQQYINENRQELLRQAETYGWSPEETQQRAAQQAKRFADQKVLDLNVMPEINPKTGIISATDPSGKSYPIDPGVQTAIYAMGQSGKNPFDITRQMDADVRANILNTWKAAAPYKTAGGTTGSTKVLAPPKLKDDPQYIALEGAYKHAEKYYTLLAKDENATPEDLKKARDEFSQAAQNLRNYSYSFGTKPAGPGGTPESVAGLYGGMPAGGGTMGATTVPATTPQWAIPGYQDLGTPITPSAAAPTTGMAQSSADFGIPSNVSAPLPLSAMPPTIQSTGGNTQMFGIPPWLQWLQNNQVTEQQMQQAGVPAIQPNY